MAEVDIIGLLRDKPTEQTGMVVQMERQLAQRRSDLMHLDATMQLFDPDIRPGEVRPRQERTQSIWFGRDECLRLIYDELREASEPLTTRALAERIMRVKALPVADERQRELIQKTILSSLNRAKRTIARVKTAGVVSWQLSSAGCARFQ